MRAADRKKWLEWTQIGSNLAVWASLVIAIGLYLSQRNDAAQLQRQQLTAELVLRKYDDGLRQAYMRIGLAYDSANPLFEVYLTPGQETGKQQLTAQIIEQAGLENIKLLTDYYDDLLGCVEQGLCDRPTAERLTGRDIRNFYCKARFVGLPELRKKFYYPEYGARLARFSGECEGKTG